MRSEPSSRPHVLTLIETIGHGGAEGVAVDLALGTDPDRFRRSLCVTRPADGDAESLSRHRRLCAAGIDVLSLERSGRADLAAWRRLGGFLRRERVDIVHAHMFGSNVWAALLGGMVRVPVVIAHEHTWSFEGQLGRRLIDRWVVARGSDAVIAVSDADRRRMIEIVGMPAERVVMIPNGICALPAGDPGVIRTELGITGDAPVLAMVAVVRAQKAIDVMLEALVIIRTRHPATQLLIAGPGDPTDLVATAARLGVADHAHFLGARSDVPDVLAGSNVGVLSSDFEGSPLAVLEYMAAGLPIVSTDVGGVPQMITDGESGLLVPRRDPTALAAAVTAVLDDPALARRLGETGRRRQGAEFSAQAMTTRVSELYERLLGDPRRRSAAASWRTRGAGMPPPAAA